VIIVEKPIAQHNSRNSSREHLEANLIFTQRSHASSVYLQHDRVNNLKDLHYAIKIGPCPMPSRHSTYWPFFPPNLTVAFRRLDAPQGSRGSGVWQPWGDMRARGSGHAGKYDICRKSNRESKASSD